MYGVEVQGLEVRGCGLEKIPPEHQIRGCYFHSDLRFLFLLSCWWASYT